VHGSVLSVRVVVRAAMERTLGTQPAARERLATECAFAGMNCKCKFVALEPVFPVHSGFLTFRHDRRRSSPGFGVRRADERVSALRSRTRAVYGFDCELRPLLHVRRIGRSGFSWVFLA